jgi:hypothetical protein
MLLWLLLLLLLLWLHCLLLLLLLGRNVGPEPRGGLAGEEAANEGKAGGGGCGKGSRRLGWARQRRTPRIESCLRRFLR